ERLVRGCAESCIRTAVGCQNIDTLLTTRRDAVEQAVKEALQPALDRCAAGVRVLDVNLIDVHAPPDVHEAFREVASAAEEKMETINTAYEYLERVVRQARGEAAQRMVAAQGRAVDTVERAKGEGTAFGEQWAAYRMHPAITRLRLYFETLDAVLGDLRKYIHVSARSGEGLDLWLIQKEAQADLPMVPNSAGKPEP
ncbi:MAG: SPFH domain-containing protein, partial [Planctomycetota bacterium]